MSVDPRRTQPFCTPRCYRECRCSRWPDYKNRFGEYVVPHDEDQEYYEKVLSYGPFAYWPQWETVGPTADNIEGTAAYDGTYVGPTLANLLGPDTVNMAPRYDGLNDLITLPAAALDVPFNPNAGTMMIWGHVLNAGIWVDNTYHCLALLGTNVNNRVILIKQGVAEANTLGWAYVAGGITKNVVAAVTPLDWFHMAITWDTAANQMRAFYNGVQTGATQVGLGVWVGALQAAWSYIGAYNAPTFYWNGWLAHCAVWNTALTPAQIADISAI